MNVPRTVYFDNAATTSPLPCVLEKLHELNSNVFGNPSSSHRKGKQARDILDESHEILGRHFNVPPSHIVFTSGGTESNNLAIWGSLGGLLQAFQWLKSSASPEGKLLTTVAEHAATTKPFESLECMGAPVRWIPIDQEGLLDLAFLESEVSQGRTKLLSIHHAQNEIGTVQDIKKIVELVRSKQADALIHIDAIQSFMKIPVDLAELGVDLVSVSSHKIGGPKGVGAVILGKRFENRSQKLGPLIQGSSQQYGMRPGTVAVPLVRSFVSAVEWGTQNLQESKSRLITLRQRLVSSLPEQAVINGPRDISAENPRRAPQTVNFSIPGLPSSVTLEALSARGFCVSAGSACHSTNPKPNETLMQMGAGRERALSSIRVSLGHQNTADEVDLFLKALREVISQYA